MQSPPKPYVFESDLALLLSEFVAEKQRLGFKYNSVEAYLKSFDTFLLKKDCKSSLSKELMLEWIAPKAHQKSTTIEHRIYIMQHLADFLNRRGFSAYRIPSELIPRKVHDFVPYIFTYDEITRILAVVDGFQFNKCSPKRHIVYPLLFRVLCFCGLRISEALNLTVGDVHFDDGFFLLRNTKTSLDRLIPLDDNLRARFMAYSEQMGFLRKDEYFFPSPDGSRYSLATMDTTFRAVSYTHLDVYKRQGTGLARPLSV